MADLMPATSLAAVPGRRRLTIEMAQNIERRGFTGIFAPSMFGNMSLCEGLAWNTSTIRFATAIAPIYSRTVTDFAQSSAFIHEISAGRFSLGIGISHGPSHIRMGVTPGKPLGDTANFVEKFRAVDGVGPLPPVLVAAMRQKMVKLAGEIGQGVIFANAALSHMKASLAALPTEARDNPNFLIGNMIPTCISDDVAAARAVCRKSLIAYAFLPNYRNYWKEAGYVDEMAAIERAIAENRRDDVPGLLTDRWLADVSLFGSATTVRDRVGEWRDAGVSTPIIVPSSAAGGQLKAIEEMFATFA